MASYQPIQMPQTSGFDGFANAFRRIGEIRRQKEQDTAEAFRTGEMAKRQKQQDQERVFGQAQALAAKGDMAGARSLLALHGLNPQEQQREVPGQVDVPQAAPGPAQGQAPSLPMQELSDPNAISEQGAAEDWQQSAQPAHPLVALAQKAKAETAAKNKRMYQTLTGRFEGGQEFTIDPEAPRHAALGRMDAAAAGAQGDATVKDLYPQMRMVSEATGQPLDPKEMFGQFRQHANLQAAEARADERHGNALAAEERRNKERREMFDLAEAGRNQRTSVIAASRPDAETKQIEKQQKVLNIEQDYETTAQKVLQNYKFADLRQGRGKLEELATAVAGAGENAALAAITAGAFTKMAQGGTGVVSDNDLRVFWERIGGWGIRTEQAFRNAWDGKLGPEKQAQVKQAVEALVGSSNKRMDEIGAAMNSAISRLPGGAERAPGIIKVYVPSYAARLEAGQKKKPSATTASPEDQAAVEWARANPDDPRAAKILKRNGM